MDHMRIFEAIVRLVHRDGVGGGTTTRAIAALIDLPPAEVEAGVDDLLDVGIVCPRSRPVDCAGAAGGSRIRLCAEDSDEQVEGLRVEMRALLRSGSWPEAHDRLRALRFAARRRDRRRERAPSQRAADRARGGGHEEGA